MAKAEKGHFRFGGFLSNYSFSGRRHFSSHNGHAVRFSKPKVGTTQSDYRRQTSAWSWRSWLKSDGSESTSGCCLGT